MAARCALVFSADDHYALGLAVTAYSACRHLKVSEPVDVHILDSGLSAESLTRLRRVVKRSGLRGELIITAVDSERLRTLGTSSALGASTYSRLLLPTLLDASTERAIYLDVDMLVRRDLGPLLTIDLEGLPMAAVRDVALDRDTQPQRPYFNAGLLVLDLPRWRVDGLAERVLAYATEHAGELTWADQDALNAVIGEWLDLGYSWNAQQGTLFAEVHPEHLAPAAALLAERDDLYRSAAVLHFTGQKPWMHTCRTPGTIAWVIESARSGWYTRDEILPRLSRTLLRMLRFRFGMARRRSWQRAVRRRSGPNRA